MDASFERVFSTNGCDFSICIFPGVRDVTFHISFYTRTMCSLILTVSSDSICILFEIQYRIEYPDSGEPIYACAIMRSSDSGGCIYFAFKFNVPLALPYASVYGVIKWGLYLLFRQQDNHTATQTNISTSFNQLFTLFRDEDGLFSILAKQSERIWRAC